MPDKSVLFPTLGLIFCFTLAAQDPPDRFYWETLQYQYPELHGQDLPAVWLLGWGPQGKVGFVMEAEEGAFVKVFDLVEDQVLFLQDFPGLSGREIWDQQVDLIRDLRERFGLQASDRQPTVYPFLHQGRYYQILQRAQRDALGQSFLSYDLVLKATGLGEKIVGSFRGPWAWTYPIGILMSPRENRIAIFALEYPLQRRRTLAPRWRVVGAHLSLGFN
jgi:hypothetical protein